MTRTGDRFGGAGSHFQNVSEPMRRVATCSTRSTPAVLILGDSLADIWDTVVTRSVGNNASSRTSCRHPLPNPMLRPSESITIRPSAVTFAIVT